MFEITLTPTPGGSGFRFAQPHLPEYGSAGWPQAGRGGKRKNFSEKADCMTDSKKRFSDRVEYYVRSRPKYPAALLQFFQTELGLTAANTVVDIGSGTGFLTELFVRNGNLTFAVEPNAEMRLAADAYLGDQPNFRSV